MTPKQMNAIELCLWKRPDIIPESDWLTYADWNKIKSDIDLGTASDIIKMFKDNNHLMAISQIKHLINTK